MVETLSPRRPGPVKLVLGGRLPLDFANTRLRVSLREDLPDFEALAEWAWQIGIVESDGLAQLKRTAAENPAAARAAHAEALVLREALYRIFLAAALGEQANPIDLERLSARVAEARTLQMLVQNGSAFTWAWRSDQPELHRPELEVALAAADMLAHDELSRVKECPAPDGCKWLFFDESKNRSRRWCSMAHCGAAAKARRFSARHG